jgi:hypothetical protein
LTGDAPRAIQVSFLAAAALLVVALVPVRLRMPPRRRARCAPHDQLAARTSINSAAREPINTA